jgi:hypothetical protein
LFCRWAWKRGCYQVPLCIVYSTMVHNHLPPELFTMSSTQPWNHSMRFKRMSLYSVLRISPSSIQNIFSLSAEGTELTKYNCTTLPISARCLNPIPQHPRPSSHLQPLLKPSSRSRHVGDSCGQFLLHTIDPTSSLHLPPPHQYLSLVTKKKQQFGTVHRLVVSQHHGCRSYREAN